MIIQIERSGGFTGILLQSQVDTHQLAVEDRQTVETLVSAAVFYELPAKIASHATGADRFTYRIQIDNGTKKHVVEVGDGAASPDLSELIRQVTALARGSRA